MQITTTRGHHFGGDDAGISGTDGSIGPSHAHQGARCDWDSRGAAKSASSPGLSQILPRAERKTANPRPARSARWCRVPNNAPSDPLCNHVHMLLRVLIIFQVATRAPALLEGPEH